MTQDTPTLDLEKLGSLAAAYAAAVALIPSDKDYARDEVAASARYFDFMTARNAFKDALTPEVGYLLLSSASQALRLREALKAIHQRARSDLGNRTFDDCSRDLMLIDDLCRAALTPINGETK